MTSWNIGDKATFIVPLPAGGTMYIIGRVEYVNVFNALNTYIHGTIPAIKGISKLEGTFSAAFYNDTISANLQYSDHIQYELRPASIQR